jgi:hypothetical protein
MSAATSAFAIRVSWYGSNTVPNALEIFRIRVSAGLEMSPRFTIEFEDPSAIVLCLGLRL